MKRFLAAASLLLIVCVSLSLWPGCVRLQTPPSSQGPGSLSEVTTASSVSPDGQPLSAASVFVASTPTIYVTAKVTNAPENTSITARWFYVKDDTGKAVNQQLSEDSATAKGTKYVSFSRQSTGAWGSGEYSVSLLMNDKEVTNVQFTVQPVQKANVPAPTISYFKAVPEAISSGQAVTLSWSVTGANTVQISTIGNVATAGNVIVTPVNSVEYQLTATNGAGSTSMKVNINVTSFNPDKPELVITDFHVNGDKAYYKIKNIGGVNAKQSTTFLYIEGVKKTSSLVDILAVGEEREQYFPNFVWTYGANRTFKIPLRICADGLDQIGEYDENNNCLVVDW
ncbi:MAG: hypothetical protein NTZ34_03975 [Chloroflexi bacterium]|nr:hypothetical protein [Chloroflexota bacterium]